MRRHHKKIHAASVVRYLFMIALVAFTLLPLVYVVSTSVKPMEELFLYPPRFFPKRVTFNNFHDLLGALSSSDVPFLRYVVNSLVVSVSTVALTIIISAMGAYAIAKLKPSGGRTIMALVIAALMFSPQVTMIPSYMVINKMGLVDSTLALILPKIATSFSFFLMERFMYQIPNALIEAAQIDSASQWQIFWKIVMPGVKPAWATLIVFTFISSWNDYMTPLIYINQQQLKTLPLALQLLSGGAGAASLGRAGAVAAATFLMIVPVVVVFILMQRQVIETMTYSGIKA